MKNIPLEALRAFAALMVLAGHLYTKTTDLPQIAPLNYLLNWGTEAVIIFFILSGFVIRLSQERRETSFKGFIVNRLIRIYPLYVFSVLISLGVAVLVGQSVPIYTALGNFLFLQSLPAYIVGVIPTNEALWSLAYEIFFYLLFSISLLNQRMFIIWIILAIASVIFYDFQIWSNWLNHFRSLLAFSLIWLLGYGMAAYRDKFCFDRSFVFSLLPLAFAFSRISFIDNYYDIYRLTGFAILCLPLFNVFTSHSSYKIRTNHSLVWFLCIIIIALMWKFSNSHYVTKLALSGASLGGVLLAPYLVIGFRLIAKIKRPIAYIASISYALYIIHMPILYGLDYLIEGKPVLILISTVILSFIISHFLELFCQPKITRFIKARWS